MPQQNCSGVRMYGWREQEHHYFILYDLKQHCNRFALKSHANCLILPILCAFIKFAQIIQIEKQLNLAKFTVENTGYNVLIWNA